MSDNSNPNRKQQNEGFSNPLPDPDIIKKGFTSPIPEPVNPPPPPPPKEQSKEN